MNALDGPDDDLVRATVDGDRSAFGVLVRRHHPRLKVVVYGMTRNATATEDVLQDTYLNAFRSLRFYRFDASFGTWIHRIAVNASLDFIRRRQRLTVMEQTERVSPTSVENEVASRVVILDALQGLNDMQRAVVLLVDGQEFDYNTAANILDISRDALAGHLHAARKTLRARLGNAGEAR